MYRWYVIGMYVHDKKLPSISQAAVENQKKVNRTQTSGLELHPDHQHPSVGRAGFATIPYIDSFSLIHRARKLAEVALLL